MGDRILHGRGGAEEVAEGPKCEAALEWIRPIADQAAKDAEASGDFQLPRQAGRLRERERDARWVSEEEMENGDEQITMVGRRRLTVSNPLLNPPTVSTLESIIS